MSCSRQEWWCLLHCPFQTPDGVQTFCPGREVMAPRCSGLVFPGVLADDVLVLSSVDLLSGGLITPPGLLGLRTT